MNFSRTCQCCGHTVTAYTVVLNEALVMALLKFADARVRVGAPVAKREIDLSHSQYGNFQKLRHFGLIERRDGDRWEMTTLGWDFVLGRAAVKNPAGQFGNATLSDDHEAWATHVEPRREVRIGEILPETWRQRADYIAEKRGAA